MLITEIKMLDKRKGLVYIDYERAFSLYKSEIRSLKIKENESLSKEVYDVIIKEILPKRCLTRAGFLLEKSDKTEKDLRDKLKQGYFPQDIIDITINKLKDAGYLNDRRYVDNYIRYNIKSKSVAKIKKYLITKGVDKNVIQESIDNYGIELEQEGFVIRELQYSLIEKEFKKKHIEDKIEDKALLNKVISSMLRKGFEYDDIMHVYDSL